MNLTFELLLQMLYAMGIGLLIGLERTLVLTAPEQRRTQSVPPPDPVDPPFSEAPPLGVRTFAVLSLVGFIAAMANERFPFVAPVTLGGLCLLVLATYIRTGERGPGITTEAAAVGTCCLGMLCRFAPHSAGVLALLLTVILASKRFTHSTIRKMRWVELTDTLKFLVIVLIVLPILPNRALDPYEAFNPYKVGVLVVLISGISFVGYFLTRLLGAQKGLGLTGALGGLTSSTAVTAAMAERARGNENLRTICAFSAVVANATMFGRVLVVVGLIDLSLLMRLVWPVGTMAVVATLAAVALWLRASNAEEAAGERAGQVPLENPFSLGPAIKFGIFFVGILFVAKLARQFLGDSGLYLAAAVSGLADVDAITLSVAEQVGNGSLAGHIGALGITIAIVTNSVVKTAIAVYSGGLRFGWLVGVCLLPATVLGLTVAFAF